MSNYRKKIVSCFDIGEVPRSPGIWNWNRLSFLPFIFSFEHCECIRSYHMNNFWGISNGFTQDQYATKKLGTLARTAVKCTMGWNIFWRINLIYCYCEFHAPLHREIIAFQNFNIPISIDTSIKTHQFVCIRQALSEYWILSDL